MIFKNRGPLKGILFFISIVFPIATKLGAEQDAPQCFLNLSTLTRNLDFQPSVSPHFDSHFPFIPGLEPTFFQTLVSPELKIQAQKLDFVYSIFRGRVFLEKLNLPIAAYNDLGDLFWINLEIQNLLKLQSEIDQYPDQLSPLASQIINWLETSFPKKYKNPTPEFLRVFVSNPFILAENLEKIALKMAEDLNLKKILFLGQPTPLAQIFDSELPKKSPRAWILPAALTFELRNRDIFGESVNVFQDSLSQFQNSLKSKPLNSKARLAVKNRLEQLDQVANVLLIRRNKAESTCVSEVQKQTIRKSFAAVLNDISLEKQILIRLTGQSDSVN